jgi:hypothetical protein
MKTPHVFALAAAALGVGFLTARWCTAQPSVQPPVVQPCAREPATYDFGAMQQLASFIAYLQATGQTNILHRWHDLTAASLATQHNGDMGTTLAILERLRDGRTNQAYELLEGRLDADIICFVASYRELPKSACDQPQLKVLSWARDYRARYPFKPQYPYADDGVADAFKILDEKKSPDAISGR